jgi:hypothetical protein
MSFTMTRTASESFTLTNSKVLASKVTTDMRRCQQNYGRPTDSEINNYGTELALMLRDAYVAEYEFGYKRDGNRVVSWHYTVIDGNLTASDDRPGKIVSGVDISGATFFNFMTYSVDWSLLTPGQRETYRNQLPINRPEGVPPSNGSGYWSTDLSYSSGGVSLNRRTFRPY